MKKRFDDLTIADDFMFCRVMVSNNARPCTLFDHEFFREKLAHIQLARRPAGTIRSGTDAAQAE